MAIDGIIVTNITNKLNDLILKGKITKIQQPSEHEILLTIRSLRMNHKLLISSHSMYARTQITYSDYQEQPISNTFNTVLRKHLDGGIIESIEQIGIDRIIQMSIRAFDALGDEKKFFLMIEMMGKHSNISLLNENQIIIDCIKHVSFAQNSFRVMLPNATYIMPPRQEKISPMLLTAPFDDKIVGAYEGVSNLLANEIIYQQENLIEDCIQSDQLFIYEDNHKSYFHAIELTHLGIQGQVYPLFVGLDAYFFNKNERDRIKQQTQDLSRYLLQEQKKLKSKKLKLEAELDTALNSDELRINGDLLFASLHLIQKGQSSVEVDDYYTNQKKIIPLDIKLSAKENALKYYKRYQKQKNALQHLDDQIQKITNELVYFDSLIVLLEHATLSDALEIRVELEQEGYLKKRLTKLKPKKTYKFLSFTSESDASILVGKNHIQNDLLTFKVAHKNDLWFHAKGMPGSHVVVRGGINDEQTIRLAAMLAAFYSKGKYSSSVPVDYTLVKNIKKPSGAKPGQVNITEFQTIYIDPDEAYLNQIPQNYYEFKTNKK